MRWILVKYSSGYEVDILGPKTFITQVLRDILCPCFSLNPVCVLDTLWIEASVLPGDLASNFKLWDLVLLLYLYQSLIDSLAKDMLLILKSLQLEKCYHF